VDIRAAFDEFLGIVCEAAGIPITSVHFGPGAARPTSSSPSRISRGGIKEGEGGDGKGDRHTIHYIDSEGDVVGITSSDCYEAARDQVKVVVQASTSLVHITIRILTMNIDSQRVGRARNEMGCMWGNRGVTNPNPKP